MGGGRLRVGTLTLPVTQRGGLSGIPGTLGKIGTFPGRGRGRKEAGYPSSCSYIGVFVYPRACLPRYGEALFPPQRF